MVIVTGINAYKDEADAYFNIEKAANTMKVKPTRKTYKRPTLTAAKTFTIKTTNAKGEVTYQLNSAAKNAGFKVSSAGVVTVPKNCKVGKNYQIRVRAAGDDNYKAKNVLVTVRVIKVANTMKATVTQQTYLKKELKEPASFDIGVTEAKGKVTYTAAASAKAVGITVTSKGKVTVPAKCKRGHYRIRVKAAGNGSYRAKTIFVKVTVK